MNINKLLNKFNNNRIAENFTYMKKRFNAFKIKKERM